MVYNLQAHHIFQFCKHEATRFYLLAFSLKIQTKKPLISAISGVRCLDTLSPSLSHFPLTFCMLFFFTIVLTFVLSFWIYWLKSAPNKMNISQPQVFLFVQHKWKLVCIVNVTLNIIARFCLTVYFCVSFD